MPRFSYAQNMIIEAALIGYLIAGVHAMLLAITIMLGWQLLVAAYQESAAKQQEQKRLNTIPRGSRRDV